jgi:hypothetical protein
MKAVLLDAPGPPSSLRIGELADPAPLPDEVLVRVRPRSDGAVNHKSIKDSVHDRRRQKRVDYEEQR